MMQKKYAAIFHYENGSLLETEVIEGMIEGVDEHGQTQFRCVLRGQDALIHAAPHQIFDTKIEAEKRIHAGLAWHEKKTLTALVDGHIDFLPEMLAEPKGVYLSGNPLRMGEPMIAFSAQSNAWGAQDNPQKVLQLAGAVWEDISMLWRILFVLGFANNYAKKLVGKYMIIELNSLFLCLQRLSALDATYKDTLFAELLGDISTLEQTYHFRAIRNKIGAHRDTNMDLLVSTSFWNSITRHSIAKHVEAFGQHLDKVFVLYPHEGRAYFRTNGMMLRGIEGSPGSSDYQRFDEPFERPSVPADGGS